MNYWHSKLPWIVLMIALLGDFIVAYVLAFFYPGYSHRKHVMSVLGNPKSPVAKMYNSWLIVLGLLICLSSYKMYIEYSQESGLYAGLIFIIMCLFGIGAGILSGLFSVEENRESESVASKIHGIGAGVGFLLFAFIPLIIGLLFIKEANFIPGIISIIIFVTGIVFFVLFIMSEKDIYKDSFIGLSGLWQRLLLGAMYLPVLMVASIHVFFN